MPRRDECYDFPQYWDLAFRDETRAEADFFQAAFARYVSRPVRRLLEPGCGGGRLVVEMAARGYHVTALDLNPNCVQYTRRRLARRGLAADVFVGDMRDFDVPRQVDAAFNTFNTFRHLTTEADARAHLRSMAAAVRPGGIYILGFHLLPPDADEAAQERWSARHAKTTVHVALRVLECDRRRRIETIRFTLRIRSGETRLMLRSDYDYRIYTAAQVQQLLASVPQWELCDVFDFWYDLDQPLTLDDELGDTVLILRRKPSA